MTAQKLKGAPANAGLAMFAMRVIELPCTTPDMGTSAVVVDACVIVKLAAGDELLVLKLLSPWYCAISECWPVLKPKYPFGVTV